MKMYNYKVVDGTGLKVNIKKGELFFKEYLSKDEVKARLETDYDYTYVKEELKEQLTRGVEYALKALIERDMGGKWVIIRKGK